MTAAELSTPCSAAMRKPSPEFQTFLDWLRTRSQAEIVRYAPKREAAGIDFLQQGRNPFDAQTLEALRSE